MHSIFTAHRHSKLCKHCITATIGMSIHRSCSGIKSNQR